MLFDSLFSGRKQFSSLVLLLISLCSYGQIYFNDLENPPMTGNWIGMQTIDSGNAYSGYHFSQTDSLTPYGLGIHQEFPENLINNNTTLLVSGYVMSRTGNSATYVITVVDENNETTMWKGIPLVNTITDSGQWHYFSDSILIPASITVNSKIKTYLWNQDRKFNTYIDDLKFEFKQFQNPSFIPEISLPVLASYDQKVLFENNYYAISYSSTNKALSIKGINKKTIVENINYYSEREIKNIKLSSQARWKFMGSRNILNGKQLRFKISEKKLKVILSLTCDNTSGVIHFDIDDIHSRKQNVYREVIVIELYEPVNEVYRNNRKLDNSLLQREYWLYNEGLKFGADNNPTIIYHTPNISSLQVNTDDQLLFVNLDYEKDHPFFRFPLNPDSTDWKLEQSTSSFERRTKRNSSFSMTIGNKSITIPRFMKNPSGYEATYIWTEHADYSDIRTNRATYFGSENITDADSSTGGFVYYDIPVTKSVFYDNPDSISNFKVSNGAFNTLESTILTDPEFADYLFQISLKGNDICLHTPEQYTTTPERLEDALLYMQMNFGSPSWIDHGNNNGPQNNREDLICDATLKDSPYYAIKLWKKYGVKYLHNAYYEELNTYKDWQFEGSLEKPYSGYGDFIPKPDYFLHPTKTENLYHWTTTSALFIKDQYLWNYLFNPKKLGDLVDNWYVEINHAYPAWVDPKKGMWTYDSDSTIIAQPGFNQSLANMAELRDQGRLNITTIADYLDYRTAIDNVDYQILTDGRVKVTNNNNLNIDGLSMVVKAKAVIVDGLIPYSKQHKDEIIFWFDLDANESKVIRIVD